jgi:hypothetical protein
LKAAPWLAVSLLLVAAPARAEVTNFVLGEASAGFDGASARLTLARGRPDVWLGIDVDPAIKVDHTGGYAGLRLGTPHVDIAGGFFGAIAVRRSFLPIQDSYTREDADVRVGGAVARYGGVSSAMELRFGLLGGEFESETQAAYVLSPPRDRYVFVEHLNVINGPSWTLYQRLAQRFPVGHDIVLGGATELLWLDARDAPVLRLGPEARFEPNDWFALYFVLLPTVVSPDHTGLTGATFDFGVWVRFW